MVASSERGRNANLELGQRGMAKLEPPGERDLPGGNGGWFGWGIVILEEKEQWVDSVAGRGSMPC